MWKQMWLANAFVDMIAAFVAYMAIIIGLIGVAMNTVDKDWYYVFYSAVMFWLGVWLWERTA